MPALSHYLQSSLQERASHITQPGPLPVCFLLGGLLMGTCSQALAQAPSRGATPAELVGASMAVLATLQDAEVLPPEGTPDANRAIKAVIHFQSVFLKSGDPAVQLFLTQALTAQGEHNADNTLSRFHSTGWTSNVLEALSEQWIATQGDQRDHLAPGFRQFNISPEDFDWFMKFITKARATFMQRGQN